MPSCTWPRKLAAPRSPHALATPAASLCSARLRRSYLPCGVSKKAARTAAKQAHGAALAEAWGLEDALAAAWAEEARLLGAANAAREVDQRRRDNLDQFKRRPSSVTMIDLTVDRGSREARRQVTLAQLAAGTAELMN